MAASSLSNRARCMRLYRHALKDSLHWVFSRDVWMAEAVKIRSEFEAYKHVTEPAAVSALLDKGEKQLATETHPNPYIVPYFYGGSMYARNPPVPTEIKIHMDWAREEQQL
mmetsp:Transcript_26231/g.46658  ORF Transcript_26231/g.46658 Transcript_26231/m.46658 type:complete len:111 (-) Transcript_26231:172-504(-)|eukprot:CAMPEP_0168607988 /NCGR_PEP_ID=MMETSP0449_2-20121227/376_1 /TAXON_ID=1082188 /ORGANISM="Strombidium rassoulzadegani, Strain ras09" /LENGTH=110 /DNA_ID=CAMNT_0008647921 /DNA_START=9 /DNA_END=341 /DNA_ORIENTATION=+